MVEAAPEILLERVTKRLGQMQLLHETTLGIPRGCSVAIVGPSGAGKSTLLRLTVGLLTPDTGRVLVAGEEMTPASAMRLRRRMGYVVQDGGLFPHLTARKNVTLVAEYIGWDIARTTARARELGELVGLDAGALERYPSELSGGQRQRVGVMRALMLDPEILLLDEPLGALDPIVRARLRRDFVRIFRGLDKTVMLVTHDMTEARTLAEEIVVVESGRIVQRGNAEELRTHPASPIVSSLMDEGAA